MQESRSRLSIRHEFIRRQKTVKGHSVKISAAGTLRFVNHGL
jgi:hypothetical protein